MTFYSLPECDLRAAALPTFSPGQLFPGHSVAFSGFLQQPRGSCPGQHVHTKDMQHAPTPDSHNPGTNKHCPSGVKLWHYAAECCTTELTGCRPVQGLFFLLPPPLCNAGAMHSMHAAQGMSSWPQSLNHALPARLCAPLPCPLSTTSIRHRSSHLAPTKWHAGLTSYTARAQGVWW